LQFVIAPPKKFRRCDQAPLSSEWPFRSLRWSIDMTIVTPTTSQATTTGDAPATNRSPSTALSADAFLTLLIAEFKNQDPTSPIDPTQTVGQLALLSQLQALQDIDSTLKRLEAAQNAAATAAAPSADSDMPTP
jgi:flagellar hook assembly protein FlgD